MSGATLSMSLTEGSRYYELKRINTLSDLINKRDELHGYTISKKSGFIQHAGNLNNKSLNELRQLLEQGLYVATAIPNPYAGKVTEATYPNQAGGICFW